MIARKWILAFTLLVALVAAGCSSSKKDAATKNGSGGSTAASGSAIKVGFITKFPVDFYSVMVDAVKSYASAHPNVKVLYAQGKNATDDTSEIAAIQDMVTQGVKAIAITPTSPAVQPALQKAVDKGIKVVLIDNDIPGWAGKSAYVATNNEKGGGVAGAFLAQQLKPGSTLAVLEGVSGNATLKQRVTGMEAALGGQIKVVASLPTNCDQTMGFNAAQDILAAHPDISAIYGACGPPTTGAIQAIKAKNKNNIIVVGFDADAPQIADIKAGHELASVIQFPAKMGSIGIDTAVKVAQGQSVPANVDTGTGLVTKANADQFG